MNKSKTGSSSEVRVQIWDSGQPGILATQTLSRGSVTFPSWPGGIIGASFGHYWEWHSGGGTKEFWFFIPKAGRREPGKGSWGRGLCLPLWGEGTVVLLEASSLSWQLTGTRAGRDLAVRLSEDYEVSTWEEHHLSGISQKPVVRTEAAGGTDGLTSWKREGNAELASSPQLTDLTGKRNWEWPVLGHLSFYKSDIT